MMTWWCRVTGVKKSVRMLRLIMWASAWCVWRDVMDKWCYGVNFLMLKHYLWLAEPADRFFCLLTSFWQELADICLGQAVRQHNGLFKSAFLHWNVSIYPSSTWLDKCPAHPTVIGLACFRMLDSNSSYQTGETCQFLIWHQFLS